MPRKRKIPEVKIESSAEDFDESKVKSEPDEDSTTSGNGEDNNRFTRSLRPRKTRCYVENDSPSPSPEVQEKQVPKVHWKKRRKASENDENYDNSRGKQTNEGVVAPAIPSSEVCEDPEKLKVSENTAPTTETSSKEEDEHPVAADLKSNKPKTSRKRPKPKKVSGDDKSIKTEPLLSPQPVPKIELQPTESVQNVSNGDNNETAGPQPKAKPKRIRKKKPIVAITLSTEAPDRVKDESAELEAVVKKEATEENEESKNMKKLLATKKPSRKPKIISKTKADTHRQTETDIFPKPNEEENNEDDSKPKVSNSPPVDKTFNELPKKKRNRPNKPAVVPPLTTDSKPIEEEASGIDKIVDELLSENKKIGDNPEMPTTRRVFGRGRRSKFLSSRIGKKEIVHTDEAIDPEDIRGFEHVERYEAPEGIRLPKFWDSEDELSDDENCDNFRRIMCGFGTNCRVHEVIRPASEIVRRFKELQTSFGSTRTLALFQRDAAGIAENQLHDDNDSSKPTLESSIIWHNDPMFFKYANNFP